MSPGQPSDSSGGGSAAGAAGQDVATPPGPQLPGSIIAGYLPPFTHMQGQGGVLGLTSGQAQGLHGNFFPPPFLLNAAFNPVVAQQMAAAAARAAAGASGSSVSPVKPRGRGRGPGARRGQCRQCNCKNSRCLKLYCECFASGRYCDGCNCINCCNNSENETVRQAAIATILERNPNAFRPKIADEEAGVSGPRHNKGCNCKKSGCLKKYCECFQAGIPCSANCKCIDCKNYPSSEYRASLLGTPSGSTVAGTRGELASAPARSPLLPSLQGVAGLGGGGLPTFVGGTLGVGTPGYAAALGASQGYGAGASGAPGYASGLGTVTPGYGSALGGGLQGSFDAGASAATPGGYPPAGGPSPARPSSVPYGVLSPLHDQDAGTPSTGIGGATPRAPGPSGQGGSTKDPSPQTMPSNVPDLLTPPMVPMPTVLSTSQRAAAMQEAFRQTVTDEVLSKVGILMVLLPQERLDDWNRTGGRPSELGAPVGDTADSRGAGGAAGPDGAHPLIEGDAPGAPAGAGAGAGAGAAPQVKLEAAAAHGPGWGDATPASGGSTPTTTGAAGVGATGPTAVHEAGWAAAVRSDGLGSASGAPTAPATAAGSAAEIDANASTPALPNGGGADLSPDDDREGLFEDQERVVLLEIASTMDMFSKSIAEKMDRWTRAANEQATAFAAFGRGGGQASLGGALGIAGLTPGGPYSLLPFPTATATHTARAGFGGMPGVPPHS